MDVILIPIHLSDHWVAIAIYPQLCRIAYYNSLNETARSVAKISDASPMTFALAHI
jgi:Ulp1 family protease